MIAYLDGELSERRRRLVAEHINLCWQCRTNFQELEQQVQDLVTALNESGDFGPANQAAAKAALLTWKRGYERDLALAPRVGRLPRSLHHWALAAATAASVVLAVLYFSASKTASAKPEELLARARQYEERQDAAAGVLRQEIQVRIERTGRRPDRRTGRLEIWSEADSRQFALLWKSDAGELRHALYRSEDRQFVYQPAMGQRLLPHAGLRGEPPSAVQLALDAVASEDLEAALLRWLERREWKPLLLAGDFAEFGSRRNVTLRIDAPVPGEPPGLMRISAWQKAGDRRITAVLMLDPDTCQPRFQRVEFSDGRERLVVLLATGRSVRLPAGSIPASLFGLGGHEISRPRLPPRADVPAETPVPPTDLDAIEIDARYALHRMGACLGEPIEVTRAGGRIRVHGLAETEARRQELVEALSEIAAGPLLEAGIRTVEEALQNRLEPSGPGPAPASSSHQVFAPARSHFEEELRSLLGSEDNVVPQFSEHVLTAAAALLDNAWALRRLAERYPVHECGRLSRRSRWLLEVMIREHANAARERTLDLDGRLGPLLSVISDGAPPAEFFWPDRDGAWSQSAFELLGAAREVHDMVDAVLTGRVVARDSRKADGGGREEAVRSAMQLRQALPLLGRRLGELDGAATAQLREEAREAAARPREPTAIRETKVPERSSK